MCSVGLLDDVKLFIEHKLVNHGIIIQGLNYAYTHNQHAIFAYLLQYGARFNHHTHYYMKIEFMGLLLTYSERKNLLPTSDHRLSHILSNYHDLNIMVASGFDINANNVYLLEVCIDRGMYSQALNLIEKYGANPHLLTKEAVNKLKLKAKAQPENIDLILFLSLLE
jgi:hypothetical protein